MIAGSWLIASVHIDLTKHSSSATPGGVRQQLAEPRPALAVLRELEAEPASGSDAWLARHAGEPLAAADAVRQRLAVLLVQQRLVVEQVLLRRPAALEQVDDPLRLGWVVESSQRAFLCEDKSGSRDARATEPNPRADLPKNSRRVRPIKACEVHVIVSIPPRPN